MTVGTYSGSITDFTTGKGLASTLVSITTDANGAVPATGLIFTDATGGTAATPPVATSNAQGNLTVFATPGTYWGKAAGQQFTFEMVVQDPPGGAAANAVAIAANTAAIALRAPLASPALTGAPTINGSNALSQAVGNATFVPSVIITGAGVDPTGITDSTAAIQAILSGAGGKTAYLPPGIYLVTASLTVPYNTSLLMAPNATLKANAAIAGALLQLGDYTNAWRGQTCIGGIVDCHGLANDGVFAPLSVNSKIRDTVVYNPNRHGFVAGDLGATGPSYELDVYGVKVDANLAVGFRLPPAGSFGVWLRNCFDSNVTSSVVVNQETGFRNDKNDNVFTNCHAYGLGGAAYNPTTGYDDNGSDNGYVNCRVDSPALYGMRFRTPYRWRVLGGFINNIAASPAPDNVIVAIHADVANSQGSVLGVDILGTAATGRIAKDYDGNVGPTGALFRAYGNQINNVVLTNLTPDVIDSLNVTNLRLSGAATRIIMSAGNPSGSYGANAGDLLIRTDTPAVANQRLYMCSGGTVWTAIA